METPSVSDVLPDQIAGLPACAPMNDSPVREYICSLATELAHMARSDGDENLGAVLDVAAALAQRPS